MLEKILIVTVRNNMNIEQQRVVEHIYGPAAVLAGAGSGKTTTLINRITELIKVTKPDRIVMLTFTNAAADEMKYKAFADFLKNNGINVSLLMI